MIAAVSKTLYPPKLSDKLEDFENVISQYGLVYSKADKMRSLSAQRLELGRIQRFSASLKLR